MTMARTDIGAVKTIKICHRHDAEAAMVKTDIPMAEMVKAGIAADTAAAKNETNPPPQQREDKDGNCPQTTPVITSTSSMKPMWKSTPDPSVLGPEYERYNTPKVSHLGRTPSSMTEVHTQRNGSTTILRP